MSDFFFDCIFVNLFGGFFSVEQQTVSIFVVASMETLYTRPLICISKNASVSYWAAAMLMCLPVRRRPYFTLFFSCFDWRSGGHFLIHRPF